MRKGNKVLICFFIILFVLGIGVGFLVGKSLKKKETKDPVVEQPPVVDVSGIEDFNLQMFQLENNKKNMIYSPLSMKYALKLLDEGAANNTKTEIDKVVGSKDLTFYENVKDHLSLANSIFIRNTYKDYVKDSYIDNVKNKYRSEIIYDEFQNATNINHWIEEKTFQMLKNIVRDEQVNNPDSEMVLINALAIDMAWSSRFDTDRTRGEIFTKEDGSKIEATTMYDSYTSYTKDFKYYKNDDVIAFSKDLDEYDGNQFEFIGIMPNKVSLSDYIKSLKDNDIEKLISNLENVKETKDEVHLYIPKFEYEYRMDEFVDHLKTLGIKDAFDSDKADFSNMSERDLYVHDGIHVAKVEFSEAGVKAAAVTVFVMRESSIAMPEEKNIIELKFDKPFMFLIRDKKSGEVWFMGQVYEPNLWKDDASEYGRN